jgi:hypothetical protein
MHVAVISTPQDRRRSSGNMLPLVILDKREEDSSSMELSIQPSLDLDIQGELSHTSSPTENGSEDPASRDVSSGAVCNTQFLQD